MTAWARRVGALAFAVATALSSIPSVTADDSVKTLRVYVGTYTGPKSEGIYRLELDLASGKVESKGVTKGVKNPSFLAIHPNEKFLYSVAEISDFNGKAAGGIAAFAINAHSGDLTALNQESSVGAGPCHLVVDRSGKNVLAANYGGGSVLSLPIGDDGRLRKATSFIQHEGASVDKGRQLTPHAHSINVDRNNKFAVAADLGLDKVLVYKLDPVAGTLTPNEPAFTKVAPGSGPRHFAFHPTGKFAYVINEMSLTVTAFAYDEAAGKLTEIQTLSTLPDGAMKQGSTAEVQVHPSGKFLYGSNRGHDSIVVYSIDQQTGRLTRVENEPTQGKTPRNFGIDPTGKYLLAANQASDSIVVFKINHETGALDPTGQSIEVPSPVCVKFLAVRK